VCLGPAYVGISRLSSFITVFTIPLSVLLLVAISMLDFIGYFHNCCSSFLFLLCICLLSPLFGVRLQVILPEVLVYVPAFLPSYFFVCVFLSFRAILRLLINGYINNLQYFMTNKCVVSLCIQLV